MKHFTFDVPEFIFKLADDIKSKAIETGFNRAVTKLIPGHSCNFLYGSTREIMKFFDGMEPILPQKLDVEAEPKALAIDNLMPSSVVPNNEKSQKYLTEEKKSTAQPRKASKPTTKVSSSQENRKTIDSMIPLSGATEEEEDRIVKFLREKKLADEKYIRNLKELNDKKTSKKYTKYKKPSLVTYDYNGYIIRIKKMEPGNLVRASLQGSIDSNIQLNSYRNGYEKYPTVINPKPKKRKSVQQEEVEEDSAPAPLNDLPMELFELQYGSKLVSNNRTQEKPKRIIASRYLVYDFKKLKLSRADYERLRRIEQIQQEETSKQKHSNYIVKETPKLNKVKSISLASFKTTSKEKVLVNNKELKEKYMKYTEEEEIPTQVPTSLRYTQYAPPDQQLYFLITRQPVSRNNLTKTLIQLPDIGHKHDGAAYKSRERLKNEKELLEKIHQKFEQKLRVYDKQ